MPRLLIIADDLTGANDTGVQFARRGIPTLVVVDLDSWPRGESFEVLVVNTGSRHLAPAEAAAKVRAAVRRGREAGVDHFYKKTDSTLRGNVGGELDAVMDAAGERVLPFVPAFPRLRRTTRDGAQYVGEELLHETAFARDPLDPLTESDVSRIVGRQSSRRVRVVRRFETVELEEGIYIFDALTDEDLGRIGRLLGSRGLLGVSAGSAGFAEQLADLLDLARRPVPEPRGSGSVLVVNGSLHEVSLAQIARAEQDGWVVATLPQEKGAQSVEIERMVAAGRDVVLRGCAPGGRREARPSMAEDLGSIAGRVLARGDFGRLAIFGGDTLLAVARACGWTGLLLRAEMLPGIVLTEVAGLEGELLLITKAGGFGPENLLQRIRDYRGGLSDDDRHHDGG
jgi:uncharacterized protein YgbK (DUF1537 family)